ncbi:MAG: protein arginine kinase [Candidatus Firestonebacteria bacterium]
MFEDLVQHGSYWLDNLGPNSDIVISSRIRLARNVEGLPFPQLMKDSDYVKLAESVKRAISKTTMLKDAKIINLNDVSELDRLILMERHTISFDQVVNNRKKGVVFNKDEQVSIMINEEDHLRMQIIQPGMRLLSCWNLIDKLDSEMEEDIIYTFSVDIGYLTACPTNVGTGLRSSTMVHLPGLTLSKDIGKVLHKISQLGLVVRGLYGEGIEIKTSFFQISNQVSLGYTEKEIISSIEKITKQVVEYEKKARESLFKNSRAKIEDSIWRSYGILKNVRSINFEEIVRLLSSLRLGVESNIVNINIKTINELLIITQPGHIQKLFGKNMSEEERDEKRAELVRNKLKEGEKDVS